MSINSLTSQAVERSVEATSRNAVVAGAAPGAGAAGGAAGTTKPAGPTSGALDALIKFIPTEAIALYLAAAALMPSLQKFYPSTVLNIVKDSLYWGFALGLTPLLFILVLLAKRREKSLVPLIPKVPDFPWYDFVAATIAFIVWAMLIPNGPFESAALGVVGPVIALAVSMLLKLLEQIFAKPAA
jgi:hypothetical protein